MLEDILCYSPTPSEVRDLFYKALQPISHSKEIILIVKSDVKSYVGSLNHFKETYGFEELLILSLRFVVTTPNEDC